MDQKKTFVFVMLILATLEGIKGKPIPQEGSKSSSLGDALNGLKDACQQYQKM